MRIYLRDPRGAVNLTETNSHVPLSRGGGQHEKCGFLLTIKFAFGYITNYNSDIDYYQLLERLR